MAVHRPLVALCTRTQIVLEYVLELPVVHWYRRSLSFVQFYVPVSVCGTCTRLYQVAEHRFPQSTIPHTHEPPHQHEPRANTCPFSQQILVQHIELETKQKQHKGRHKRSYQKLETHKTQDFISIGFSFRSSFNSCFKIQPRLVPNTNSFIIFGITNKSWKKILDRFSGRITTAHLAVLCF